jgi:hypothetical protein
MYDSGSPASGSERQRTPEACFRAGVAFAPPGETLDRGGVIRMIGLSAHEYEPQGLSDKSLPLLVVPEDSERTGDGNACRVIVAVEGRDTHMAGALAALLDPAKVGIALVHVTWIPGIAGAPMGEGGLDNPAASDLLAYEGAREALIGTADALEEAGFSVSTHLREDRDPAGPLAELIEYYRPDLFVLGLGRHGPGIGRRLLERVRVPVLYVQAR